MNGEILCAVSKAWNFFHQAAFALRPVTWWWNSTFSLLPTMNHEPQAIEVEIVEIDGIAPPAKFDRSDASSSDPSGREQPKWKQWRGRVQQLDSRWWPLWVILGAIMIVLLLTVGLFLGIIFVIFLALRGIARAIFG